MKGHLYGWPERAGEQFLRTVGVKRRSVVLDFGCRRGTYALPAARLVGPRGQVLAVDKNRDVLDELMRAAARERLTNIRRIDTRGDVRLPLADETVDVILLYDVIHLIGWSEGEQGAVRRSTVADRRRLLEEMHRVARPGGLLSVYATHLDTHTDAASETQIRDEIEACGFCFLDDLHCDLVHDEKLVRGHVVNFTRARSDRPQRKLRRWGPLARFLGWWGAIFAFFTAFTVCPFSGQPSCVGGPAFGGVFGGVLAFLVSVLRRGLCAQRTPTTGHPYHRKRREQRTPDVQLQRHR
jgi:SAM-dependent methyltransferase